MARTTFVDCVRRDPRHAMEAVLTVIRGARGGSNVVVVKTDDGHLVGHVRDWARELGVPGTVRRDHGVYEVRLSLLPTTFGALPEPTRDARQATAA